MNYPTIEQVENADWSSWRPGTGSCQAPGPLPWIASLTSFKSGWRKNKPHFQEALKPLLPPHRKEEKIIPYDYLWGMKWGCALAVVDLVAIYRICEEFRAARTPQELAFGNYSLGRFAWKLGNVRPIKEPFTVRGRQKLFEVEIPEGLL